ncbi:hypothetical protein NXS13_03795 [Corynebacterium sp. ES2730-CONJ]|uniref:hypothetical protein n=1 Tax=Corynebacterium sp. ES2730-CONJ TaxID=2973941 RepID=UPI00216B1095|nr:hypothetical protein [Corynebacterium sp. ES2730-CONJ]MCS4531629.1 hypothetical protein [Corynebacterium sp. ES2730-CONJ]
MSEPGSKPELVAFAIKLLSGIFLIEILHQIIATVGAIIHRDTLIRQIQQAYADSDAGLKPGPAMLDLLAIVSICFSALVAIALVGVFAWFVTTLSQRGKRSAMARRLLIYVCIYLSVRGIFVFAVTEANAMSLVLLAINGSLQILIGVGAALAVYLLGREEMRRWAEDDTNSTPLLSIRS